MYVSLLYCGPEMLTCFQFLLPSAKMREFAFSFHGLGASITINGNNINNKNDDSFHLTLFMYWSSWIIILISG